MTKKINIFTALVITTSALAAAGSGCELIAAVDRSKLPSSTGGGGTGGTGGMTTTTSMTTTTPGTGGTGGGTGGMPNLCNGGATCMAATDCPASTTTCVTNTCVGGCCGTTNAASTTACTDNGSVCDGSGKCVACLMASDCTAPTTKCKTATCDGTAHTCGTSNAAKGTTCNDNGGVVCDGSGACVTAHCADGVLDADETDVDCGGSCGANCKDTGPQQKCKVSGDCVSGVCSGTPLLCQPPSCTDGVKNGNETDQDCGGARLRRQRGPAPSATTR